METNPLHDLKFHDGMGGAPHVYWDHPGLKIERLRLVSDPGFGWWDVSYCYGRLPDGTRVRVNLPFSQLVKGTPISKQVIEYAKREGIYAKGIGVLAAISTLN